MRGRERILFNDSSRYQGTYRGGYSPSGPYLIFTATDTGYITPKVTFSTGTVTVNDNAMTSGTEYALAVTKDDIVTFAFSNPEAVTAIDMGYDPLFGSVNQFTQFPNLASLVLPDMDPKGHVGVELVVDGAYPVALTNWTETETGGTVTVAGGVIIVARVNGAVSAGQDILTLGSAYNALINITATSGTVQIQDNDGTVIKSITATGMQDIEFFSKAVS